MKTVRLDSLLATFVSAALTSDSPLAPEALATLRGSGGHGVTLDTLTEAAVAGALAALQGIGYAPTSNLPLEALAGASGAIGAFGGAIIRDSIANDAAYLERRLALDSLLYRDEPLELLKAEFAPAFAALRARRDVLQSAEGARDCAASALGFARMAGECANPEHAERWQETAARSAGSALWFAMLQTCPEAVAAFRVVLESVPQLSVTKG